MAKNTRSESTILFKMIQEEYGKYLTTAELKEVHEEVEDLANNSMSLRAVKLANNVEPFIVFKPYRRGK